MDSANGDVRTGVSIVLRALEEPIRQIATNAGLEGSVIVDKIVSSTESIVTDIPTEEPPMMPQGGGMSGMY